MKKAILSLIILLGGCFTASAQEAEQTKEVFNPHWFVGAQVGAQETLGEIKTSKLFSPNAQIYAGYQFTPLWALRVGVGGWQSKGGIMFDGNRYGYSWGYVAPTADVMFNLTNAIGGYKPNRIVDVNLLAGIGANIAIDNSEANSVRGALANSTQLDWLTLYWKGHRTSMLGRFGATVDFNVSKRVALGVEANANFLSDHYNSKDAPNCDWYFNVLAGIKVKLGKVTKKVPVKTCCMKTRIDTVYITKEVPVIVEKPVASSSTAAAVVKEKIRRDIFFTICKSEVSNAEMSKVDDIASYMNRWPNAKVTITGYADKGTGNAQGNIVYARNRANIVAKLLKEKYGIAPERIIVDSKGDTVQPYEQNELNRVSICIAE